MDDPDRQVPGPLRCAAGGGVVLLLTLVFDYGTSHEELSTGTSPWDAVVVAGLLLLAATSPLLLPHATRLLSRRSARFRRWSATPMPTS